MAGLSHAIDILQAHADRVADRLSSRLEYERIARHSLDLTAELRAELASLRAALDILRTAQAAAELAEADCCRGDCLLCDAPLACCPGDPPPAA